jgi:hypothetical protein
VQDVSAHRDGQVDFKGSFRSSPNTGLMVGPCSNGNAVRSTEQGTVTPFIADHLIRRTERAFDDFAGGKSDQRLCVK